MPLVLFIFAFLFLAVFPDGHEWIQNLTGVIFCVGAAISFQLTEIIKKLGKPTTINIYRDKDGSEQDN